MIIKNVLGTTEEKIKAKQHRILVPVCVRNKYFKPDHIIDYIDWALEHTKDDVAVLIGDKLHTVNLMVLDKLSKHSADLAADKMGDAFLYKINEYKNQLPKDISSKVRPFKWNKAEKSNKYQIAFASVSREYETNVEFKNEIIKITKDNLGGVLKGTTKEEQRLLGTYMVQEIAMQMNGTYLDKVYDTMLYPSDSVYDFIDKIQKGEKYPGIIECYKTNPETKDFSKYQFCQVTGISESYQLELNR